VLGVLEDWRTMGPTEPVRSASHAVLRQFRDIDHAQIGLARSKDGLTHWERCPDNPIIRVKQAAAFRGRTASDSVIAQSEVEDFSPRMRTLAPDHEHREMMLP